MRKFIMALSLAYAGQLYKRFEFALDHPYRSLFYAHMEALTDLWAILTIVGVVTGFVHITF